jgi:predicted enzyme related to lactoylglutathione lyase
MAEPVGWLRAIVFDVADIDRAAAFWQAVVGVGILEDMDGWRALQPDPGGAYFAFEPLDDSSGPDGPAGGGRRPQRARPDIEVTDLDAAQARIEELGGRLIEVMHGPGGEVHKRMADPDGNEFTIVLPLPPEVRANLPQH